jgi:hypothetical protein
MHRSGLAIAALLTAGCATQSPIAYAGRTEPAIVPARDVTEAPAVPASHEKLGELRGRCVLTAGFRAIDDELLSDVDCSERRLARGLAEAAADAGGDLLIARQCASRSLGNQRTEVFCRAGVARPTEELLATRVLAPQRAPSDERPAPSPEAVERLDEPSVSATSGVRVAFTPKVRSFSFPQRRADLVRELSVLPISHRALGDLITRCEGGCSLSDLRFALYATAGRLGATDVVGVRCFAEQAGSACVATAAAPERNPDTDVAAR